jgi:ATP-dependent DNA ligase
VSTILPQRLTPVRAEVASVDWLFEPFWPGERIIVRCAPDGGDAWSGLGEPVADGRELAARIGAALPVDSASLDGIRTESGAVVLVDLLALEGEPLLEVPFQERRRLLVSVVVESDAVRIGPVVKHPVGGWLATWRADGFTHYIAKHQNARYAPGEQNEEWLKIPIVLDSGAGFVGRLIGSRGRVRRIGD